jgi:hypothetical protein
MSTPPDGKHYALQEKLRDLATAVYVPSDRVDTGVVRMGLAPPAPDVLVPAAELITLLDYITELEDVAYHAWEDRMGEDL